MLEEHVQSKYIIHRSTTIIWISSTTTTFDWSQFIVGIRVLHVAIVSMIEHISHGLAVNTYKPIEPIESISISNRSYCIVSLTIVTHSYR